MLKRVWILGLLVALGSPRVSLGTWDNLFNWFDSNPTTPAPVAGLPEEMARLHHFPTLVAELTQLYANLIAIETLARETGLQVGPEGLLWKELLDGKVIRQWRAKRALTVVVAGGTKTGKSTTFNHLAGRPISKVSHVSAETKQSVLTVPPSLSDFQMLSDLFPDLVLRDYRDPAASAEDTGSVHNLIVQSIQGMPDDMMFIDVPDVDSTNRTNWEKAYRVSRGADVIVAMITPEKHGDDATTEFFRQVAAFSQKPIVVVIKIRWKTVSGKTG